MKKIIFALAVLFLVTPVLAFALYAPQLNSPTQIQTVGIGMPSGVTRVGIWGDADVRIVLCNAGDLTTCTFDVSQIGVQGKFWVIAYNPGIVNGATTQGAAVAAAISNGWDYGPVWIDSSDHWSLTDPNILPDSTNSVVATIATASSSLDAALGFPVGPESLSFMQRAILLVLGTAMGVLFYLQKWFIALAIILIIVGVLYQGFRFFRR